MPPGHGPASCTAASPVSVGLLVTGPGRAVRAVGGIGKSSGCRPARPIWSNSPCFGRLWRRSVVEGVAAEACRAETVRVEERRLTVRVHAELLLGPQASRKAEVQEPGASQPASPFMAGDR